VLLCAACGLCLLRILPGCSLLVNQSASQCAEDSDCAAFAGTRCASGACVVAPGFDAAVDPGAPCTSTQDCLTLHGSNWVCRSNVCKALGSDQCGIVLGNYTADDVLLLGAILPIYGPHKSTGLPMERALAFAVEQDFGGGVPLGLDGGARPLAVVLCDESQDPVGAAQHLADDVNVPAILGPAFGDSFLAVAAQVAVPKGVLLFSPYATADLSSLAADAGGGGLAWRTAPSSDGEAAAMANVVSAILEPRIQSQEHPARLAVSVVWRSDADGTSLHTSLLSSLSFNGFPATAPINEDVFTDVSYGNSDAPGEEATAAVTKVTSSPLPQLVIVIGRTEAVTDIVEGIENVWPSTAAPPYYLVSHGLQVEELLTLVTSFPTLRARLLSTAPGDNEMTNAALRDLLIRYQQLYSDYPSETFGLAQAFDAYYALAYGLAAVRNADVVGLDERDGLEKVLFGPGTPQPVTVGPEAIGVAFAAIRAGTPLALQGASGALQFDAATGTPLANVQVWCVTQAAGTGVPVFTSAGVAWSAATATLTGSLASGCLVE
jgi:ABC-type branched-subunit amino acid transport system substrate-binding protein